MAVVGRAALVRARPRAARVDAGRRRGCVSVPAAVAGGRPHSDARSGGRGAMLVAG